MMNNEKEKEKDAIDTSKLDEILPKYEPLKLNGINLAQNYVSAFNTGMNIYQCVNQLQGYIEWVVKSVNDVVKLWDDSVDETLDQSIAITKDTTIEQFNKEWTEKQPELIEQVNTLTTNQFNEDWGVLENRINTTLETQNTKINTTLETQNTKINSIQTQQTNLANEQTTLSNAQTTLSNRMDTFTSLSEGSTTGDAELKDIRVGANDVTYNNAGDAVRGQYTQLNDELSTVVYPNVNLSDKDIRVIKKLYIPIGTKFRIETLNGQNFGQTTTLRLLDVNKNEIDYYSIFENNSYRDMINNFDKDIHYIKLNGGPGINPFKAVSFIQSTLSGRIDKLESNVFNEKGYPSFYESYILDRIESIKSKDILIGNSGDSFTFITDLHDQNNYYSPFLAKKIYDNTSVNKIVYGGDYINEPSSKETALSLLSDRRNKCMVKDDVIFLRGNHDTNPYGTGQLTVGEFYSIFDKHIEKHINTNKNTYFYYDNESQKIRYIFVDSGVDGTISDTQKNWIKANTENLSDEWTIVVFMHHGIYTDVKDDRTNIKTYTSLNTVKQVLSNVTAKIACIICGHSHIDLSDTSGAYPIICTTCDAHGVQASSMSSDNRDAGTINEQAFDVFHIDTANKKIYVTRIGGGKNNVISTKNYALNDREFNYI